MIRAGLGAQYVGLTGPGLGLHCRGLPGQGWHLFGLWRTLFSADARGPRREEREERGEREERREDRGQEGKR